MFFVLRYSFLEIICHPNIQSSGLAGHDVYIIVLHRIDLATLTKTQKVIPSPKSHSEPQKSFRAQKVIPSVAEESIKSCLFNS